MADGTEDRDASTTVEDTPKPDELRALASACETLFIRLRSWFEVGDELVANIAEISSETVSAELHDPQLVAGFAMRKLQALHHVAQPGVRTTTDVVVTQIDSVLRALVEAPTGHLARAAESTDWDHDWQILDAGMFMPPDCPKSEALEFRNLVGQLVEARKAVIKASPTGICVFC